MRRRRRRASAAIAQPIIKGDNPMSKKKTLTASDLQQFTGSENWYRHGLMKSIVFTDGAKFLADRAGAYWLLDEIALAQKFDKRVAGEEFQLWILTVNLDKSSATLACEDGNGKTVYSKEIEYTDFPLPEVKLYFTDNTLLLPSEY
jgi:hypothetical protein